MKPLISVIITTYNRREILNRAIESVVKQTFKDWELFIVDDCSTDDTEEKMRWVNPKIKYIRRKKNWGNQTRPINEVLPLTKGKYICFLDSDNEYMPDHLQTLLKSITASPSLDLVYGDRLFIDETGQMPTQVGVFHDFAPQLLLQRNYIDMSDFLVKRSCLLYVGGMDERYKRFADWNLLVRLVKAGFKFQRVPMIITKYHYHSESLSAKVIENKEDPNKPLWNPYELEVRLPYLGKIPEPRVAIFTLTKDRLNYTKQSFKSIKDLAGYPYSHFVIDNGSTDGTKEWLESTYQPHYVFYNKENVGISKASNQALDAMGDKFQIVCKIDNDAIFLTEDWLLHMVNIYKRNHMLAVSGFPEGLIDSPGGAPRSAYGNLNGHLLGMTSHLGGLCHVTSSEAYKDWRWDEDGPKHGVQDLLFSQYLEKKGFGMAYVEDIRVSHGPEGTEQQKKDYPEYFEKRIEEKKVEDPNSKVYWDKVYGNEGLDDLEHRDDEFSFKIIRENIVKGKILDVGVGSGFLLQYLFKNKVPGKFYGIDLSDEGIMIAKARVPKAYLMQGNVYEMPYMDNFFDCVVSTEVLEHLQDIDKAVGQIHRVLKEGGVSLNLLPFEHTLPSSEHVAEYDEDKIKKVFKKFSRVETKVYEHPTFITLNQGVITGHCKLLFVKAIK